MPRNPEKMFINLTRADIETADEFNPTNLRNTLFIGLGGFGCSTIRKLKQQIHELVPERADGYFFLGLDTHQREMDDVLEANEYVPLSLGVIPDEVARKQPAQLNWYRELVGNYEARSITAGADQMKALGRLAFRIGATFSDFMEALESARRGLQAFREGFTPGVTPKVYIISSVAGGTGAGCLLDVMFVVGHYFRQHLGPDFPFQAILISPEAFAQKVRRGAMPRLHANSYATLKEMYHFLASGHSVVEDYDNDVMKDLKVDGGLLPRVIHFLGASNESGAIVASEPNEVSALAVSYVMSELITPIDIAAGGARVQDMENEEFTHQGENGLSWRIFSSFGVVRAGFPIAEVEANFGLRLIREVLARETLEPSIAFEEAENWIDENRLREAGKEVDHLQDAIKQKMPDHMRVAVDAYGTLLDNPDFKKLVSDAKKYANNQRQFYEESRKPRITTITERLGEELTAGFRQEIDTRISNATLGSAMAFLDKVLANLKLQSKGLKEEVVTARELSEQRWKDLQFSLGALQEAIPGVFFRKKRVNLAVGDFESRLESLIANDIDIWIKEAGVAIYARIVKAANAEKRRLSVVLQVSASRLKSVERNLLRASSEIDRLASIEERGEGGRFSIVDAANVHALYKDIFTEVDVSASVQRLRTSWLQPDEDGPFSAGLMLDTKATPAKWIVEAGARTVTAEVTSKLAGMDLITVMNRFMPTDADKRLFFSQIQSLSSPLFPLDANDEENDYPEYWIVAVNPEKKRQFHRAFGANLRVNINYAHIDSKYEFILYQIKYGYTPHSHRTIEISEAHYERLQKDYETARRDRKPVKPLHGWVGAHTWDDLVPDLQTEATLKWFVMGRAFNFLFPTKGEASDSRKNTAYLYARGSNYYINMDSREGAQKVPLGNGLDSALYNLSDRTDLLDMLAKSIEVKIHAVDLAELHQRLKSEYRPLLAQEKEKAVGSRNEVRSEILRKMLRAFDEFVESNLVTSVA